MISVPGVPAIGISSPFFALICITRLSTFDERHSDCDIQTGYTISIPCSPPVHGTTCSQQRVLDFGRSYYRCIHANARCFSRFGKIDVQTRNSQLLLTAELCFSYQHQWERNDLTNSSPKMISVTEAVGLLRSNAPSSRSRLQGTSCRKQAWRYCFPYIAGECELIARFEKSSHLLGVERLQRARLEVLRDVYVFEP